MLSMAARYFWKKLVDTKINLFHDYPNIIISILTLLNGKCCFLAQLWIPQSQIICIMYSWYSKD